MRYLLLGLFMFYGKVHGQSPKVDSLLLSINHLQVKRSDSNYACGMFRSQRNYLSIKRKSWQDNNIFFTALIVWTLKEMRPYLSMKNQQICDSIMIGATSNYYLYQNKDGGPTYNFWQTNPSRHFPNSAYFSKKKKYILPDDLDDTSIIYLSMDFNDSLKKAVKKLIFENANNEKGKIRNTKRKYRHVEAYSTWFGANMPIDFDICVQANALRFVFDNHLKLDKKDSATIKLIKQMVMSNIYLRKSAYVSPHYQNPSIILYHLSRLVSSQNAALMDDIRPKLIGDIRNQLGKVIHPIEKMLLQTALLKFGEMIRSQPIITEKDMNDFYFFVANMTSVFPNPIKGMFAKSRKTNFFYNCSAYYLTLVLENELLGLNHRVM